jgi:hypothetical protein
MYPIPLAFTAKMFTAKIQCVENTELAGFPASFLGGKSANPADLYLLVYLPLVRWMIRGFFRLKPLRYAKSASQECTPMSGEPGAIAMEKPYTASEPVNPGGPSEQSTPEQSCDRVRNHTPAAVNQAIDDKMLELVQDYARQSDETISQRIQALAQEWDTERVLETNASLLALTGLMLGLTVNPNWFFLPGLVLLFLFQHAVQGWCPPLPIIRRLGVRTATEIAQETYMLKALRGDFANLIYTSVPEQGDRAQSAWQAVKG